MDFRRQIVTAGVYVNVGGYFPFQLGPRKSGEVLGITRLGGHRENDETGWECAAREAFEEASLHVDSLHPPATYWADATDEGTLQRRRWRSYLYGDIAPVLIMPRDGMRIAPIYLGYSHDEPRPAAESKALLLLRPEEIHQLVSEPTTLKDYLDRGGQAIFRKKLSKQMVMEPSGPLRLLSLLLRMHPEIALMHQELALAGR